MFWCVFPYTFELTMVLLLLQTLYGDVLLNSHHTRDFYKRLERIQSPDDLLLGEAIRREESQRVQALQAQLAACQAEIAELKVRGIVCELID